MRRVFAGFEENIKRIERFWGDDYTVFARPDIREIREDALSEVMVGFAIRFGHILCVAVKRAKKLLVSIRRVLRGFRNYEFILDKITFMQN